MLFDITYEYNIRYMWIKCEVYAIFCFISKLYYIVSFQICHQLHIHVYESYMLIEISNS